MASTITKRSFDFAPWRYPRGWLLLAVVMLVVSVAVELPNGWSALGAVRIVLLGVIGFTLGQAIENIPVRGWVLADGRAAFLGRIAQLGYEAGEETAQGQVFNNKKHQFPWIAGTVVPGRAENGEMPVTVPLRFYRILKRIQA